MTPARIRFYILGPLVAIMLLVVMQVPIPYAFAQDSSDKNDTHTAGKLEINTVDELSGKRIGVINGGIYDQLVMKRVSGVTEDNILYFNSNAEAVGALATGKVDAFVTDSPIAELAISKNEGLGMVPEPIMEDQYGFVLPKGSPHTEEFNGRLEAYAKDGTLEKLKSKWVGANDEEKTMPEEGWPDPNGTLVVATTTENEPVDYAVGDRICGLCIEILELAARDLGYSLEYVNTNTSSILAEVQSGKADIGAYSFSITDERKQMVDMTVPYYHGGLVAVTRTEGYKAGEGGGLFANFATSFERTFITENRWQLILSGLAITLLISMASGALGLALGFLLVLLRRNKQGGLADKLIHLIENLMGGLPVVVVLMVLYYVLFGGIDIPGAIVAIIGFTIIFGASSGAIMWNSIRAVDAGQTEAGRALGFGDRDTFFLVVLPQAARQFAPLLVAQFVSLVKDTSIVGYITVQDLTRAGDIIRSRTMEAFFPLIAIAIVYFVLCRLMAWLLNKFFVRRLEPKEGPRTIKGVEL